TAWGPDWAHACVAGNDSRPGGTGTGTATGDTPPSSGPPRGSGTLPGNAAPSAHPANPSTTRHAAPRPLPARCGRPGGVPAASAPAGRAAPTGRGPGASAPQSP